MNTTNMVKGKARESLFRSTVLPILVLLIGIPASFILFSAVRNSVARAAQFQFERDANTAINVAENRLYAYTNVLYALRSLFASEKSVDRLRFHRFVESLDIQRRYPGFIALNYAAHVPATDKMHFEESVRADSSINPGGYPNFSIKPPGERPEYFVIVYLEPMAGNEFALGIDLAANPMAKNPDKIAAAVRMHRDSGELSASAQPLRVMRDKAATYLAMRLGVYRLGMPADTVAQRREAYIGSVGAAFDIESLIEAALHKDKLRHIRRRLYDVGMVSDQLRSNVIGERRLLFDTNNLPGRSLTSFDRDDLETTFVYKERIEIADRLWEFEYSAPKDAIISDVDKLLAPLALGGGLLASVLIFSVVYTLATSRSRALAMANEITKDLRDSESGLAEAQQMARLGNWTLDPATWIMTWSAETYRIFGLQFQTTPATYAEFLHGVHEADRAAVDQALRHSIEAGHDCDVEHRICLTDGKVRWAHTMAKPTRRNHRALVPGTIMDITERRLAEEKVKSSHEQLQALSRRLVDIQEIERRRFSSELHDVVGQNLTALSINLDILKSQLMGNENNALQTRLNDSADLVQSTTDTIENVMSELRPPMLDDYGLLPALQWYANQFSNRTGIHVEVHGNERMERLTPMAEIALFRVAQEALNNVLKHARAKCVDIRIERTGSLCVMSVADDGTGFDAASLSASRRRPGFGMVTMRERMQALGGAFEVEGAPGLGTRVELRVPC